MGIFFNPNGPESKYQIQLYGTRLPFSTHYPGNRTRTTVSIKFGKFKVRNGELETNCVLEERRDISLPTKILLTSSSATPKGKIEVYSDPDQIRAAVIEGIEFFRAELLKLEQKPRPACGEPLGRVLADVGSGRVAFTADMEQLANKIRAIKSECLGLGDIQSQTLPQVPLNLAVVFSSIDLPEMMGIINVASDISFSDFDGNMSELVGYNRSRHAQLIVSAPAILLMKAMVAFE